MAVGGLNISFSNVEPVVTDAFSSLTVVTPKADDAIEIDSPFAEQNRISGTSGGIAFAPITFFDIPTVLVEAGANDAGGGNDAIHIAPVGIVAAGLNVLALNAGIGVNTLTIDGGTVPLDANRGIGGQNLSITVNNSAIVNFTASQRLAALSINGAARVNLTAPAFQTLRTAALSIGPDAKLDVGSRAVILQSTAGAKLADFASIRSQIRSGRDGGTWSGSGIVSSTAAADASHNTNLAAIVNDRGNGTLVRNELGGQSVDADTILIKFTYSGDADLNGAINSDDFALIYAGFASQPASPNWYTGDFDYSDAVGPDDYFLIDKAFSGQASTLSQSPAPAFAETVTRKSLHRKHHHHRAKPHAAPICNQERARPMFRPCPQ